MVRSARRSSAVGDLPRLARACLALAVVAVVLSELLFIPCRGGGGPGGSRNTSRRRVSQQRPQRWRPQGRQTRAARAQAGVPALHRESRQRCRRSCSLRPSRGWRRRCWRRPARPPPPRRSSARGPPPRGARRGGRRSRGACCGLRLVRRRAAVVSPPHRVPARREGRGDALTAVNGCARCTGSCERSAGAAADAQAPLLLLRICGFRRATTRLPPGRAPGGRAA